MNKAILIFLIPVAFMFFSCATQQAPGGGPKDTIPPKVVHAVPEGYSTNFNSTNIAITFDEYFQVKNLNEQLVVSPPLSSMPEIKIKSKTLFIHFEDTLKESKTYTFNFGNAISDATENIALDNFQYVFSTGAEIDSEKVSGKVINSFNLEPVKGVAVMLYDSQKDSLPYLEKPSYFSKTKEDGTFTIKNIARGSYKLFALKEANNNYLFDSRDE
ncbi:MAG: Ig-like domain-containing protein, partial [Bacteroidia bacterium]|nr:Ig-like domain-containing protein [Bacteroidia bacterium]